MSDELSLTQFLKQHLDLSLTDLMAREEMEGKNPATIERRRRRLRQKARGGEPTPLEMRIRRLNAIEALLEKSGIPLEEIGRVDRVRLNEWQGMYKDNEGEAHLVDMDATSLILTPKSAAGPEWPPVQPATLPETVRTLPAHGTAPFRVGLNIAVILPDMQIGYYRDSNDVLHPTHDEDAMSIALQIVRNAAPDVVILLGDNLDFPELSKYRITPSFARTTQASIDRATRFLTELRANCPAGTKIVWLEGNHDKRISTYILDNARAAFGLRVGDQPDSWPILSVPALCRLDELNVEYISGYPANEYWINDNLVAIHGDRASKGSNAHAYLNDERVSIVSAHIHRREQAEKTKRVRGGRRTYMAACPGCLCRTDGAVPSTKGGSDLDGVPVTRCEDWQQGLAVVAYEPGDGQFWYDDVAIRDGKALWRGMMFDSKWAEAAA